MKKIYINKCEYCGEEFETDIKHQNQRFCSENCRYHHRQHDKRQPKKTDNIPIINEMARRSHMSYGKLKALEYMERERRLQ